MNIYIWLGIAALAAILEVFISGFMTVWFVVGALVAFVAGLLGLGVELQCILFAAVSIICLIVLRPLTLKHANKGVSEEPTPVGETAYVIDVIEPGKVGRVELNNHMTWAAYTEGEDIIQVGEKVVVVGQASAKLKVERA